MLNRWELPTTLFTFHHPRCHHHHHVNHPAHLPPSPLLPPSPSRQPPCSPSTIPATTITITPTGLLTFHHPHCHHYHHHRSHHTAHTTSKAAPHSGGIIANYLFTITHKFSYYSYIFVIINCVITTTMYYLKLTFVVYWMIISQ